MPPSLPDLPILRILPELRDALASGRDAVVLAPPGSGKTTLTALALLGESWLRGQSIVLLEPRRVAVRAAAWRMADLHGESVGSTVGYQVRLERRASAATRILVLSEGLLTRRMLRDPELTGTGLVIFDEFHERNLQADLAFALCRDIQAGVRPDLRILVMSATFDPAEIARHLRLPAVLETRGRVHPVETIFVPRPVREPLPAQVAQACRRALREQQGGVLAFLPGEGEIRSVARRLAEPPGLPPEVEMRPLYGALPKAEQDATLQPAPDGRRKLVLATSIAESSLTIDGIRAVVDSGWMRVSRFSPATGMERLETLRITRDRADQRRGRAGRLAPGVCYRLWDAATDAALVPASLPEILNADLAATVLVLADWGIPERTAPAWVTQPPEASWRQAVELLRNLAALQADGSITPHGRRMAELPMHPRLAHIILHAKSRRCGGTACLLAALLAEPVTALRPDGTRASNLQDLLDALRRGDGALLPREHGRRIRRLAADWRRVANIAEGDLPQEEAGPLLVQAFPDRVARRRGPRGELRYLLACGRGATLRLDDPLSEHEWIVAAELDDADANAAIRLGAPLPDGAVETILSEQIRRTPVLAWDRRRAVVVASEREHLGAIPLRERPDPDPDPAAIRACLCDGLRAEGLTCLAWTDSTLQLRGRIKLLRRVFPEQDWPDFSDEALLTALEEWLGPDLSGLTSLADVSRINLAAVFLARLGPARQRILDQQAPTHFRLPVGTRTRLDYVAGDTPILAARIQDLFGMTETPRIASGRVALLLHLLSPARRPVQITSDLASFWATGYAEIRKELRGRYPRHAWPENPATPTGGRGNSEKRKM